MVHTHFAFVVRGGLGADFGLKLQSRCRKGTNSYWAWQPVVPPHSVLLAT